MLIYRYEDKNGVGPGHCAAGIMSDWRYLPTPYRDGIEEFHSSHRCGCKCRRTLNTWFNKDIRRKVKGHGCFLSIYDVPDHLVNVGGIQVVFDPKHATSVRKKKQSGTSTSTDQGQARV